MKITRLIPEYSVSDQLFPDDIKTLEKQGFRTVFCHRADDEDENQPNFKQISEAANRLGILTVYLPVITGMTKIEDVIAFSKIYEKAPKPILAFCETGTNAATLWALNEVNKKDLKSVIATTMAAGLSLPYLTLDITKRTQNRLLIETIYQIVIVGGGVAGVAVATNLLSKDASLNITIIDPSETHYYQPGWTMVGGGIFSAESTARPMKSVIPIGAKWIKTSVKKIDPHLNRIFLNDGQVIKYEILIVCPGIELNWKGIKGLTETIGKNNVTSNYDYKLAPYTWELVRNLKKGKAIFTQPPMPFKCIGAPQKALYLSAEYWLKQSCLKKLTIDFYNAESSISGNNANTTLITEQANKYGINFHLNYTLARIDGSAKLAWFTQKNFKGDVSIVEKKFDMIHVVPPQQAPAFIRKSSLIDANGWVEVNHDTLQHNQYFNIYALGDVINAPNAKTAAAARKQATVVATNVLYQLRRGDQRAAYDGYGSRPLSIENGGLVLAEFGYADDCYLAFLDHSSTKYSCT